MDDIQKSVAQSLCSWFLLRSRIEFHQHHADHVVRTASVLSAANNVAVRYRYHACAYWGKVWDGHASQ